MFTSTTAAHPLCRRVVLSAATALAALSLGAADASAATVGRISGGDLNKFGNDNVVYEGAAGADELTITSSGKSMIFEDPSQTIVPTDASCVQVTPHKTVCMSIDGMLSGQILGVIARMGDGDDTVDVPANSAVGVRVDGEGGSDVLTSGSGPHQLTGGDEADTLVGGDGGDVLMGDGGTDTIDPGPGQDTVFGGAGGDIVSSADGEIDQVDCGGGMDTLAADGTDARTSCEMTSMKLAPPPPPAEQPVDGEPAPPADPAAPPADAAATAPVAAPAPVAVRRLAVGVTVMKLTRSGRVLVRVRCPKNAAGACRVTLSGRGVPSRAVTVKPGAARTVVLALTGARKRAAAEGKRVGVRLSVRAADHEVRAAAHTLRITRRAR